MQNDIVVKRPPVDTEIETVQAEQIQPEPARVENIENPQVIEAAAPSSTMPVGAIAFAIFVCLCLVSATIYSALSQ